MLTLTVMGHRKNLMKKSMVLNPGTLWSRVQEQTKLAKACGAIQSIHTESEFIVDRNIQFLVRVASNLAKRDEAKRAQVQEVNGETKSRNPFLPYDNNLFVTNISQTHVCLLNKFNVLDSHILIVTRVFEDQENLLTIEDFEALWICMAEFEGLAFYNAGTEAGASQPHKHLQMVPLPLASRGLKVPIEPVLSSSSECRNRFVATTALPYEYAISPVGSDWIIDPREAAKESLRCYTAMLEKVGLRKEASKDNTRRPGPYNFLATREWMMLVPRSKETFESISINALGFAGNLFVKNSHDLKILKTRGPMAALKEVGKPTIIGSSC